MESAVITASLEDYLEAIWNIVSKNQVARSMEIAERLKVKRPSVTVALRSLSEKGLINYEPGSYVTLTDEGQKIARSIDRKHQVLRDLLVEVFGLSAREAGDAACKMEHGVERGLCSKMACLLEAVRKDSEFGTELKGRMDAEMKILKKCESRDSNGNRPTGDGRREKDLYDLNLLKPGTSGSIVKILGKGNTKKRLYEMGITSGQEVHVMKAAPLDDPIEVKIRNYNLSLRRDEAANILVVPL